MAVNRGCLERLTSVKAQPSSPFVLLLCVLRIRQRRCAADTEYGKIGLGICYDLRFAHLSLLMSSMGCKMLVFPGAFNTTTGPVHWELLIRGRALDNQVPIAFFEMLVPTAYPLCCAVLSDSPAVFPVSAWCCLFLPLACLCTRSCSWRHARLRAMLGLVTPLGDIPLS